MGWLHSGWSVALGRDRMGQGRRQRREGRWSAERVRGTRAWEGGEGAQFVDSTMRWRLGPRRAAMHVPDWRRISADRFEGGLARWSGGVRSMGSPTRLSHRRLCHAPSSRLAFSAAARRQAPAHRLPPLASRSMGFSTGEREDKDSRLISRFIRGLCAKQPRRTTYPYQTDPNLIV